MYVLGCLLQKPALLFEVDKYKIVKEDFDDKFTKVLFIALDTLARSGARAITTVDIEAYLNTNNPIAQRLFKENDGFNYLNDAENIANVENFDYYYTRLKKFSCLRELKAKGYSIDKIYNEDAVTLDKENKLMQNFDKMSIRDIFDSIIKDFAKLESEYVGKMSGSHGIISEGMDQLKEDLAKSPEVGFPLQGDYLNTILRGARRTKYYIRSGATGSGKTRTALGDACNIAFPYRYSKREQKWVVNGNNQKVLFVTTEIGVDELQTMIWAYLADVNEEKILYNKYEGDEEVRVMKAIELAKKYEENFYWEHLPDPTIDGVSASIRNQVRNHDITHVFYDYIFSSPSLIREFEGQGLREDVILGMLSTKLKDLANELNVFIATSTQLNRNWETAARTGIRNQNMIRGSTAIIDKADAAMITLPIMQEEVEAIKGIVQKKGDKFPTHVTDVYKLRRGRWKNVRIWSYIDLGTCRIEDLFVTNADFTECEIPIMQYQFEEW
jgi:replicative DNA helicase